MEIIALLIPIALLFLAVAIAALFWALRRDQFDDLDNAAWRVIFEDRQSSKHDTKATGSPEQALKSVNKEGRND